VIRNIIFDWSGTLVDDLPLVWTATNFVFRQAGVPELTLDQFRAEFCLPFKKFYDRYVPHVSMTQLEAWFHSRFQVEQGTVKALPHARDFLEFCRARGLRLFLLSTVHRDYFDAQTRLNGFHLCFERIYTGVWNKQEKIHELLAENRLAPGETLFVGDMQHDIETARHGGIYSCGVLTGYNRASQLREAGPTWIVEHLGELRERLEQQGMELGPAAEDEPRARERRPIATVGALVFDHEDRVLMVKTHKWSGLWGIPGGKIEYAETALEALRREIKEETALDITDARLVFVQDCIHSTEFYRDEHFILLNYTCRRVGDTPVRLNDEAVVFRWVPFPEALQLELNSPTRRLLERLQQEGVPSTGL
jgi:phosphoglycolate phosphatase-like HAD superfamily hydrolase/ADP-ribose pyrophosphatase YjhB (NUDIX family)